MEKEQFTIFDYIDDPKNRVFKVDPNKKVKLIEAFGGIGSQAMGLRDIGVEFEPFLIEYDKYPVASYNAIHGTNFPTRDITKIHAKDLGINDKEHYTYIFCYSFPCQDLSVAGKLGINGKGISKENQQNEATRTRSGLLWEVERILTEMEMEYSPKPDVLILENVPNLHGKANMSDFQKWLDFLESIGYSNFWQDMNASDYGIAQSRRRCICVSILGNYTYKFPNPIPLKKRMIDYLEDEVDEKYYLKNPKTKELINRLVKEKKITPSSVKHTAYLNTVKLENLGSSDESRVPKLEESDVAATLLSRDYKGLSNYASNGVLEIREVRLGNVYDDEKYTGGNFGGNVWAVDGLAPSMRCTASASQQCIVEAREVLPYDEQNDIVRGDGTVGTIQCNGSSPKHNNRVIECVCVGGIGDKKSNGGTQYYQQDRVYSMGDIAMCHPSQIPGGSYKYLLIKETSWMSDWTWEIDGKLYLILIRKLTPRECWRLMDFTDQDFDRAATTNSNTQLYKQAGNSICKNILCAVMGQLFEGKENIYKERVK